MIVVDGRRGHNNIADDHLVTHSLLTRALPPPDVFHAAFASFENESVVFLTVPLLLSVSSLRRVAFLYVPSSECKIFGKEGNIIK